MLGSVDAAADKDAPLAIEYRHADAGAIGQGFEAGHALRLRHFGMARVTCAASAEIAAVAARSESIAAPEKHRGGPQAAPGSASVRAVLVRHRGLRIRRISRVLLDAADEIERGVERLIVLRIRRDIGLRAGLLVALGLEVAAQRSLPARVGACLELLGHLLQHLDVGRNALRLDGASGRVELAPACQPQRPVARAERNDGLHRALAERAGADDGRAPVILERTRHDFRGRGRAAVDQHDDRLVLGEIACARVEPLGFLGVAAARRHDLALLQERVGDRDRLIEQSARVVAQVDDEALELIAGLGGEVGDRLLQALGSLLVELGDADKADVVAFEARAHRAHLDARAGDRDLDRLVLALAHDLEFDLGVFRAAHLLDRLIGGGPLHRLVVEMRDNVVGHDAGLRRRRLVDRGHDLDQAVLHGDLDAEAAELAPGLHLHVAEALGIHVARVRIEPSQHAVDRRFDQLAVVGFFHVVGAHALEHVAEQAELAIGVGGSRLCARPIEQDARLGCDQRHGYAGRRTEEKQGSFAHDHPRTFWPSFAAHHGPGSTGTPSLRNSTYSTGWLAPPALATADWAPPPITATGSPVTTNCPKSTDIRSIPASKT